MKNKPVSDSLRLLLNTLSDGHWHGGDDLGAQLGVSRAAIWKLMTHLKTYDVLIESHKSLGYRLKEPLKLLNEDIIRANLKFGHDKICFDCFESLSSTNDYLMQRPLISDEEFVVCSAEIQTDGKGRLGRKWTSPFGKNLYLSTLWQFKADVSGLMGLSLVIALALVEALETVGLNDLNVKWPNDIYLDGQKLAGVLIEIKAESNGDSRVVIGTGVNVNMTDGDGIGQAWTSCAQALGKPVDRNEIVAAYLNVLQPALEKFTEAGLAAFMSQWNRHDYLKGKTVDLMHHREKVSGTVLGINAMGALLMNVDGEECAFTAGDTTSEL